MNNFYDFLSCVGDVHFSVKIFDKSGDFEICEGGSVVTNGRISVIDYIDLDQLAAELPTIEVGNYELPLKREDIYKDLGLRGYDYKGVFKGVKESDHTCKILKLYLCNTYW